MKRFRLLERFRLSKNHETKAIAYYQGKHVTMATGNFSSIAEIIITLRRKTNESFNIISIYDGNSQSHAHYKVTKSNNYKRMY